VEGLDLASPHQVGALELDEVRRVAERCGEPGGISTVGGCDQRSVQAADLGLVGFGESPIGDRPRRHASLLSFKMATTVQGLLRTPPAPPPDRGFLAWSPSAL